MATSETILLFIDARLSNVPQHRRDLLKTRSTQHRQTEFGCKKDCIYLVQKIRKDLRDLSTKSTTKTQTRKRKEQIPQNWRFYFQENNETFGRSNTTSNNEGSLLPKNDETLEEEIRLPTMEDLYFQKNDKTLKEVPRQHCQATTLWTLKQVISSKMGLQHLEQLQE
jgi:hypothetical protein